MLDEVEYGFMRNAVKSLRNIDENEINRMSPIQNCLFCGIAFPESMLCFGQSSCGCLVEPPNYHRCVKLTSYIEEEDRPVTGRHTTRSFPLVYWHDSCICPCSGYILFAHPAFIEEFQEQSMQPFTAIYYQFGAYSVCARCLAQTELSQMFLELVAGELRLVSCPIGAFTTNFSLGILCILVCTWVFSVSFCNPNCSEQKFRRTSSSTIRFSSSTLNPIDLKGWTLLSSVVSTYLPSNQIRD